MKFPEAALLKEPVMGEAGNTGSAPPLLGLASALEEARPAFTKEHYFWKFRPA